MSKDLTQDKKVIKVREGRALSYDKDSLTTFWKGKGGGNNKNKGEEKSKNEWRGKQSNKTINKMMLLVC